MRLAILFILTFQCARADKNILPVFLLDYDGVMAPMKTDTNPFGKVSTSYFADIVHDTIKKSEVVVIFIEEKFCAEDVSTKDKLGTPYYYLHQGLLDDKVKYFPNVIEPYKLLNQIFQPHQFNVFYLASGTKLQMLDRNFKYFYVFFQDGKNETRSQILRRHDLIMREVYFVVRQLSPGAVVAYYTGKMNPVAVEKKHFVSISPMAVNVDPGVNVFSDGALFRFVGVFATTQFRRAMFNQIPVIAEETWTRKSLSTKMAYTDFELEFNFSFKDRDWLLEYVALLEGGEEVGRTLMQVGTRWNWAYYCGEPIVLVNNRDGSSVTISEYQIQPRKPKRSGTPTQTPDLGNSRVMTPLVGEGALPRDGEGGARREGEEAPPDPEGGPPPEPEGGAPPDAETTTQGGEAPQPEGSPGGFGKAVHCGPYFSAAILSGLLVSAVFLGILAFGVMVMYDCNSNNRYDDPNAKMLVINAEGH